jgi:hypothetical protein
MKPTPKAIADYFKISLDELYQASFCAKYLYYLLQYLFPKEDADKLLRQWHKQGIVRLSYCGINLPEDTKLKLELEHIAVFQPQETKQITK